MKKQGETTDRVDRDAYKREQERLAREREARTEKRNSARSFAHTVRRGSKMKKKQTHYAHNPSYCMIRPDASDDGEDVVSTGSS